MKSLGKKIRSIFSSELQRSRNAMQWGGLIGILAHPIYYLVWTYLLPQPYDNLYLRLSAAFFCIPAFLQKYWPKRVERYLVIWWHFCLIYALPFVCTFLTIKNSFSTMWMVTEVMMIFVMALCISVPLLLMAYLISGISAAFLAVMFTSDAPLLLSTTDEANLALLPVIMLCSMVFSNTMRKGHVLVEKEKNRAILENERQRHQIILQEKEKLITLAHTVAHDISSPLSALGMMMHSCDELPENKRAVLNRAIESILDIANNLLSTYRNEEQSVASSNEPRQPVLVSDAIVQLLSEKKVQFSNRTIHFETDIAMDAQFAFAHLQPSQFRRAMSNLINNAVDALNNKNDGCITVQLMANAELINIVIQDNGKGMSPETIEKMRQRHSFTEGKAHGHGLGLQQVWDAVDFNQGTMTVHSVAGEGTSFHLTFPRVAAADWITQTIHLRLNSIVVILDDDESIHGAWDARFASYLKLYPTLQIHHFKHGRETLAFFNNLDNKDRNRIVFLSDYELLRQDKNGLQIIEESRVNNVTLVTSYYVNAQIREQAAALGVKILPKQMASVVSIGVGSNDSLAAIG